MYHCFLANNMLHAQSLIICTGACMSLAGCSPLGNVISVMRNVAMQNPGRYICLVASACADGARVFLSSPLTV